MRWLTVVLLLGMAPLCPAETADSTRARGAWFLEAGGNAAFGMTGNLEVLVRPTVALRAGAGLDVYSLTAVVPVQCVFLLGSKPSQLEAAIGVTVAHEGAPGNWHWDGTKAFVSGFLGLRHQRPSGLLLRVGVVPLLWTNAKLPWIALAIGHTW